MRGANSVVTQALPFVTLIVDRGGHFRISVGNPEGKDH
jgi:hypothetical protein